MRLGTARHAIAGSAVVAVLIAAVASAPACVGSNEAGPAAAPDAVPLGATVPDLALEPPEGASFTLAELRRGADGSPVPVVLTFWSFHCPTGASSMDRFAEVARSVERAGAKMLGVCAYGESPEEIATYAHEHGLPYRLAMDAGGTLRRTFGARIVTSTYVLDREARLVYRGALGSAEEPFPERALESILAGESVASAETRPSG